MKTKNLLFAFIALFFISACAYSEEFQQINHNNEFYIEYPSYMEECDDLTAIAELQYKNAYRNTYSIINVVEKNGQSFEDYQRNALNVIENYEALTSTLVTDSVYREGDNFKAIDIQLYTVMADENVYYWHSTFESGDQFYEVVCWTRSSDRKQRYGPDLEKVIASFRVL